MPDKKNYSYNYLLSKGFSKIAAAGIIGNLSHESNFDTTVKGKADDKGSIGIAQWHSERKQGLFNFAKKQGKKFSDLDVQLDYIIQELNDPYYKKALDGINSAKTASEATTAFMNHYEKPAEWAKKSSVGKRINEARSVLGQEVIDYTDENTEMPFTREPTVNLFPEYQQNFNQGTYLQDTEDVGDTPQSISDKAKNEIVAKQNEKAFLEEISKIQEQEQLQPQQVAQENYSSYKLAEIQHPQYENPQLPMAQNGMLFNNISPSIPNFTQVNREDYKPTPVNKNSKEEIKKTQKRLVSLGYDLGSYGESKDGVDGIMGTKTLKAIETQKVKDNKITATSKRIPGFPDYSDKAIYVDSYDKKTDTYNTNQPLSEVKVMAESPTSTRVREQLDYIKENNYEKDGNNFAIINKKSNRIYYYDKNYKLLESEPVITGEDNNDKDYSVSMRDWFKDPANKGKSHEEYYSYLKQNQTKTTPAGHFTIASLKQEVNKNQKGWKGKGLDYIKDILSGDEIGTRNKDIEEGRARDYGVTGKLFTLKSDAGTYSSKAIHGTNNSARIKAFNANGEAEKRDLSNGCININGESKCFSLLGKNSGIYILPENSEDIVTKKKQKITNGNIISTSKAKIYNYLKSKNLSADEDTINFISAVHGQESSFGTNKMIPVQDKLPFFNSDGPFQINPKSFAEYLPKNYTNTFENGIEAVYNFYNKNKKDPAKLYGLYNTGKKDKLSPYNAGFMRTYNYVKENY